MRRRGKEAKPVQPAQPTTTESGEDFFYYEMPLPKETIAELIIRTARGARIKHTVIHVHSPESEYYDNQETAYVSRLVVGENDDSTEVEPTSSVQIEKQKRLSKNPERTFRALARLTNIIKLRGHKEKDNTSEA